MSDLDTFRLPATVSGNDSDVTLARSMISAWKADGIFQIATEPDQDRKTREAIEASRRFFGMPLEVKSRHVSELSYSGYIASGEEVTAGEADYSEIFTVCKDLPLDDFRVEEGWPCHGPTPWPDADYQRAMTAFMDELGVIGEKLLKLVALGLGLAEIDALTRLTVDGWHHMRVLRFPARSAATSRGIGAHTDYGLLVVAAQDDVGGLYVRPPVDGEKRNRNWLETESSAGMYEDEEPWTYVRPVPAMFTVFPGDILQFLTGDELLSTPHKVKLNTRERYTMAYFHEPNFRTVIRPLSDPTAADRIHYGTHFTNMFMRCYPNRMSLAAFIADQRTSHHVPHAVACRALAVSDKRAVPFPDLVKQDFTAPAPNVTWVGDMTEIPTGEGKLYLSTAIDLFSRRLLGYASSCHPDAELAGETIKMAVAAHGGKERVEPDQVSITRQPNRSFSRSNTKYLSRHNFTTRSEARQIRHAIPDRLRDQCGQPGRIEVSSTIRGSSGVSILERKGGRGDRGRRGRR